MPLTQQSKGSLREGLIPQHTYTSSSLQYRTVQPPTEPIVFGDEVEGSQEDPLKNRMFELGAPALKSPVLLEWPQHVSLEEIFFVLVIFNTRNAHFYQGENELPPPDKHFSEDFAYGTRLKSSSFYLVNCHPWLPKVWEPQISVDLASSAFKLSESLHI